MLIVTVVAALTSGFSLFPRMPGDTLTNKDRRVQKYALEDFELIAPKTCKKRWHVTDTAVTKPPTQSQNEKERGVVWTRWEELWTIDECGTSVVFSVSFTKRSGSPIVMVHFKKQTKT
jgi:hypothetical protein